MAQCRSTYGKVEAKIRDKRRAHFLDKLAARKPVRITPEIRKKRIEDLIRASTFPKPLIEKAKDKLKHFSDEQLRFLDETISKKIKRNNKDFPVYADYFLSSLNCVDRDISYTKRQRHRMFESAASDFLLSIEKQSGKSLNETQEGSLAKKVIEDAKTDYLSDSSPWKFKCDIDFLDILRREYNYRKGLTNNKEVLK